MKYRVVALSVSGRGKKIYESGDVVSAEAFRPGDVGRLLDAGFIEVASKAGGVDDSIFTRGIGIANLKGHNNNAFSWVEESIRKTHYNDSSNLIIVLGYNGAEVSDLIALKKNYPDKKIIIYQLEQISAPNNLWLNPDSDQDFVLKRTRRLLSWFQNCDGIWEYSRQNLKLLDELGYGHKAELKPITKLEPFTYKVTENLDEKYDVLFYGSLNERRVELLQQVAKKFKLCVIGAGDEKEELLTAIKETGATLVFQKFFKNLHPYLRASKVVLNPHYYSIQEQVRISEALAFGCQVLSEKAVENYFGDVIEEYSNEKDCIKKLTKLIKSRRKSDNFSKFFHGEFEEKVSLDPVKARKLKVGAIYNSFYDVDLIEASVASIKPTVDHVVVVHQERSFTGFDAEPGSLEMLKDLKARKIIDDLIVIDPDEFSEHKGFAMVGKRNLGLDSVKAAGCDYVIPMDCDEFYDGDELIRELLIMQKNDYVTMYGRIFAYYGGTELGFVDSYYVPIAYKVDHRAFIRGVGASVLCDPSRRMRQGSYYVSEIMMHHLTYLPNHFEKKRKKGIRNSVFDLEYKRVYDEFIDWKGSKSVTVFQNNLKKGGAIITGKVKLVKGTHPHIFDQKLIDSKRS